MNRWRWVGGLVALAACSSAANPTTTGGGPVTAEQACADYADRACELEQRCMPGWLKNRYGNVATCRDRIRIGCPEAFQLNGTTDTPSRLESCATAMGAFTCDQFLRPWPDICHMPLGTLADGAPCGSRSQCRGGTCKQRIGACGTCATTLPEGATCTLPTECDLNSDITCNGTCSRPFAVESGGACDFDHGCAGILTCQGAGATGMGTCGDPLPEGAPCDSTSNYDGCDGTKALGCDPDTNTCKPVPQLPGIGERCWGDVCDGSGTCGADGTCQLKDSEGQPCVSSNECLSPAHCTNGTCVILEPGTCH
jgi:hypothetical protein